jgi:hypothetical protein
MSGFKPIELAMLSKSSINFYATLEYIRHFRFAGCYDNDPCDPWYLVTNLAGHLDLEGHLDLAGFYFSKCPANDRDQDLFDLYH